MRGSFASLKDGGEKQTTAKAKASHPFALSQKDGMPVVI